MPSTENPTLQRIQREISEVMEREKELRIKNFHSSNGSLDSNHHETESSSSSSPEGDILEKAVEKVNETQPEPKPMLFHSKSMGAITNGTTKNGSRLFTPNPAIRGVMNKFFKSRGKLSTTSASTTNNNNNNNTSALQSIVGAISFEPPRVIDPALCVRKGFVPVEEKMRKELQDLHTREEELREERRKSQPDFESLVEIEPPRELSTLKKAKSMAQLYNPDEYNNNNLPTSTNLKAARSLAELCDAPDDDLEVPGSHFLIMRFEELIQKNQQARS